MDLSIAEQVDVENLIIWGDALRVLLISDQISPGEINCTLREKGIFIDGSDEALTIPLLSHTLLTPTEFERLISNAYNREAALKTSTDRITLVTGDENWQKEVLANITDVTRGIQLSSGYNYLEEPRATFNTDGSVRISYKLERNDCSLDWISQRRVYEANISIRKKDKSLEVEILKGNTSKETERINSFISRGTTRILKNKGIVKEDAPRGILFSDFTNEERVRFFLSMTGASSTTFEFEELVDVDIVRDQSAGALPADPEISWMENKVKKLHVNGEKLHEINLLTNKLFHKYCFLVRMNATFKYKYGLFNGGCSVTFSFNGKGAHDADYTHTEFCTVIDSVGRHAKKNEKEIRAKISSSLGRLIDFAHKGIIDARV